MLRKALQKFRVTAYKLVVAFFSRQTDGSIESSLISDGMSFVHLPDHLRYSRDLIQQVQVGSCYKQHFGIFPGINIINRRCEHHKTLPITDPPIFNEQMNNMLYPFIINTVLPHSAFHYECRVFAHLPFLQKILSLS